MRRTMVHRMVHLMVFMYPYRNYPKSYFCTTLSKGITSYFLSTTANPRKDQNYPKYFIEIQSESSPSILYILFFR